MIRQPTAVGNARQERVALLLASGRTIKEAAAECRVGERTVHTWLGDPDFRGMVSDLQGRLLIEAVGRLSEASGRAVETLVALLQDASSQIRLRAAVAVLDQTMKARERIELEERLARLEQLVAATTEATRR
jgi:hypothetical protein